MERGWFRPRWGLLSVDWGVLEDFLFQRLIVGPDFRIGLIPLR